MFRVIVLLIFITSPVFENYRIDFDKDLSPPASIPTVEDMYYSVPLNATISKPIIAYIKYNDGSLVSSGPYSNDFYYVSSIDLSLAYNQTQSDSWQISGGKLCQHAVWWEDYPQRFDLSQAKTRCGEAKSSTTLKVMAFKGRLILDRLYHQHSAVPKEKRIFRVGHPFENFEADTNPFQLTMPAQYAEVDVQASSQIYANEDFNIRVKVRETQVNEIDIGLDSVAIIQVCVPYTMKTFYNTEEKGMMLKSTAIRLAGKNAILHQSSGDTVIRTPAKAGIANIGPIRILDPVQGIKLNVTMIKARPLFNRIPRCEKCNNDFEYREYHSNGTEFTYRPMSQATIADIKSLTFTAPITVLQQAITKISFTKKTLNLWSNWTDPTSKTVSVIKNVKIPGEIYLEAFDKKGSRIYSGGDGNFTLKYETIPSGICLSKDITKTVTGGGAHLTLSFCQITSKVQLSISVEGKSSISVNTVDFQVVGTINIAHVGNLRSANSMTDFSPYMNTFLHFAVRDVNDRVLFQDFSLAGFKLNLISYNTHGSAETAFNQAANISDPDTPPAMRNLVVINSASDKITKSMNLMLLRTSIPTISTSNVDVEFSDKFAYPLFSRICWSEEDTWKSFAMAARDRNWYNLVVVRVEGEKINDIFYKILEENGISVSKDIILPAIGSHNEVDNKADIFDSQIMMIKEYTGKVILVFADEMNQPYIFNSAHVQGIDTEHGYQWILISDYVWKYPFNNAWPCSTKFASCTEYFKGTYFIFGSYNVSGFTGKNWTRVLSQYYSSNENELSGGKIIHNSFEIGGKIALAYDAVLLFVKAFMKKVETNETTTGFSIAEMIRQSEVDGLTGKVTLNNRGDRTGYIGILGQINENALTTDTKGYIRYIHLLRTERAKVQVEIPFSSTSTLYNNVAKLYLLPSQEYNKIPISSLTGLISLQNQSLIQNPCQQWPSAPYTIIEKTVPIYSCNITCGFRLLRDSNITDYDSGVCVEGNRCQCKYGYAGSKCTVIYCNCVHGKCLTPYNCTCDPGWNGDLCNEPICRKCVHGRCVGPNDCDCDAPWGGSACNRNIAAIVIPLLLILILVAILLFLLLRKLYRQNYYYKVMNATDWVVDWETVDRCDVTEYYRTWVVISPNRRAMFYTETYKWKNKKWFVKKISSKTIPMTDTSVRKEMFSLINIKHRNLITYGGACITEPHVSLFLPVTVRGSLYDLLKMEAIEFNWDLRYSLMKDICSGMDYLHNKTDIKSHGRLKSKTCLIDYRWTVRIAGYGAPSIRYGQYRYDIDGETEDVKEFLWTAPEILQNVDNIDSVKTGSKQGDVYAFGIVVAEILTRNEPYAYELTYISERSLVGLIRDYSSPALKNSRTKWRELAGPNMRYVRPILTDDVLGFNMKHRNAFRRMLADCWNQTPSPRPSFRKLLSVIYSVSKIKCGSIENQVNLFVAYSKNLEMLVMERMAELTSSSDKFELLISQILPKKYIKEVKEGRPITPEQFECLTILVADVPDFNKICRSSKPEHIVNLLNEIFQLLKQVTSGYNVYNLNTINEYHIIVGGLDGNLQKHGASEIAAMALDLMDCFNNFAFPIQKGAQLELRIGIHSGPAFVSVIGRLVPRFCVLGRTMTVALNMMISSEPLHIHVSANMGMILQNLQGYDLQGVIKNETLDSFWLWGKRDFRSIRDKVRRVSRN